MGKCSNHAAKHLDKINYSPSLNTSNYSPFQVYLERSYINVVNPDGFILSKVYVS